LKITDRKRWVLAETKDIVDLKYVKKPDQKNLFKLQDSFREKFLRLLEDSLILEKIEDKVEYLHSVIIQELNDQHRLYFVFYIPDFEGIPREKKVAVKTVGSRIKNDKDREKHVQQLFEIKAVFGAVRNISKAIESLH